MKLSWAKLLFGMWLILFLGGIFEARWELITLHNKVSQFNTSLKVFQKQLNEIAPFPTRNIILKLKPNTDPVLADRIQGAVQLASRVYNVPEELIYSLIITESSLNPMAVSSSGCVGLMQVCPKVWGVSRRMLYDPVINILVGTKILSYYYQKTGSWQKALIKYSGGARNYVGKTLEHVNMILRVSSDNENDLP